MTRSKRPTVADLRAAAGGCFVQVGLPYGPFGDLITAEDYLRAAFKFMAVGGDCVYCAASLDIQKRLCDEAVPVVAHVGLIPSQCTWTGGFKAVGKTAPSALAVWEHVQRLEAIGVFGAKLEVVPDRVGAEISRRTSLLMLGMGAGPGADAQYLFAEDVLGHTKGHKPRHATPRPTATSPPNTPACRTSAWPLSRSSWPACRPDRSRCRRWQGRAVREAGDDRLQPPLRPELRRRQARPRRGRTRQSGAPSSTRSRPVLA